jgi:hypothetical protein
MQIPVHCKAASFAAYSTFLQPVKLTPLTVNLRLASQLHSLHTHLVLLPGQLQCCCIVSRQLCCCCCLLLLSKGQAPPVLNSSCAVCLSCLLVSLTSELVLLLDLQMQQTPCALVTAVDEYDILDPTHCAGMAASRCKQTAVKPASCDCQ